MEKGKRIGFIAQETIGVLPEVVDDSGEYYSMQYAPITAVLVEAIKEQQTEINELKVQLKQVEDLKSENEELKARLTKIEEILNKQ